MDKPGITIGMESIADQVEMAKLAEDAGFAIVWAADHPHADVFVRMAAMANATRSINIGSGIVRAFVRGSIQTAGAAADVDSIARGRLILGLGSGTKRQNLNEAGVLVEHAASQIKELIEFMRLVWSTPPGRPLRYKGRFYDITSRSRAAPGFRQSIPIYMAAVNSAMLRVTGEVCEGLAGHPCYSVPYLKGMVFPNLEAGFKRSGRQRTDFTVTSWVMTVISNDRKQARREAAAQIGFYLSTRSYGGMLDFHGWQREKAAIQEAFFVKNDLEAVADAVSDDMIDTLSITGTPDDVRKQLQRYEGVLDYPTFYTPANRMSHERMKENVRAIIETFGQ